MYLCIFIHMTDNNINFRVMDEDESQENLYKWNPDSSITTSRSSESSFDTILKEYFSKNKVLLYILTPCFGGTSHVNYMISLLKTANLFQSMNIPLKIEFCKNDSLVSRARNNLIARAMTDTESTHFLFIDNDILWNPIDILKLIVADKDVIGGAYPLKHYHMEKLVKDPNNPYNSNVVQSLIKRKNDSQFKELIQDIDMIKYNLLRYNINFVDNNFQIVNNIAKVKHLATGFMMIKRKTIAAMIQAFPSTKYKDDIGFLKPEENNMAYALFDCGVEDGHYYSEDWMFCDRWSKMGGDIFLDVSINLTHTGIEDYSGCFYSTLL
jgi:hypothetical protein